MPDKASLLTKTQRERIRNEFADLDGNKKRRDQQRIRARIAAGLDDFHLLVGYPDEQLRLAFEEYDDDQLTESLADCRIFVERVRDIRGIDRSDLSERTSERASAAKEDHPTEPSLQQLGDGPLADGDAGPAEHDGRSLWSRRADRLFKFAVCALLPVIPIWLATLALDATLFSDFAPWWVAFGTLAVVANGAGLAIKLTQLVKHDAVPGLASFLEDPRSAVVSLLSRGLMAPKRALKRSWEKL